MPTTSPSDSDPLKSDSSRQPDPSRLNQLVEQAASLQASGEESFVITVLMQLDESEREVYRKPLIDRMEDSTKETYAMGDGQATIEPSGGFRAPEESIELPPIVRTKSEEKAKQEEVPESIGKFRIKRELGRGACGAVYLGYDEELQRDVAVKVSHVSDYLQDQLKIEATKLAQIDSPGIVPVFHIGETADGQTYIVEKFIEGVSLRALIKNGPVSPAVAADLINDIAIGLEPAHRKEILHRDLKPENIMIESSGKCWIADFGLAISEDEQQKQTRELAGTPVYMAPEQIQGRVDFLDPRSDIWAIGVMFYELLTGKLPFNGKTRQALTEQICEMDPRPLQQRAPGHLTEEMNEIFLRCCAKKPADRFATVGELADAIDHLIAGGLSEVNIHGEFGGGTVSESISDPSMVGTFRTRRQSTRMQYSTRTSTIPPPAKSHGSGVVSGLVTAAAVVVLAIGGLLGYQVYRGDLASADSEAAAEPESQLSPEMLSPEMASVVPLTGDRDVMEATDIEPTTVDDDSIGEVASSGQDDDVQSGPVAVQPVEPENAMGLDLADGSRLKPWVVDPDGSGSHRTLSEAIAAGPVNATVRVMPGNYEESITITQPVTLEGITERVDGRKTYVCEISSRQSTPVTVDCPDGQVVISGFAIIGRGHRSTTEFNAIDVVDGSLTLDTCELQTKSFNCVKVHGGATLSVDDCEFLESRDFAISSKDSGNIVVTQCSFISSGIQVVGGTGVIDGCKFYGNFGVYVAHTAKPVQMTECEFDGNLEYGVTATNGGVVVATGTEFRNCGKAVLTAVTDPDHEKQGAVKLVDCRLEECAIGVYLQGGILETADRCRIQAGRVGIAVEGGRINAKNLFIQECKEDGISVVGEAEIELNDCRIERCGRTGIRMKYGKLTFHQGKIRNCRLEAILFGDKDRWPTMTAQGELRNVQITAVSAAATGNTSAGIMVYSGPLKLQDVTLDGGQIGLYVEGPKRVSGPGAEPKLTVDGERTYIVNQTTIGVFASGDARVRLEEGSLAAADGGKNAQAVAPATIVQIDPNET